MSDLGKEDTAVRASQQGGGTKQGALQIWLPLDSVTRGTSVEGLPHANDGWEVSTKLGGRHLASGWESPLLF